MSYQKEEGRMLKKVMWSIIGVTFLCGTLSCGTIIYPERRGQRTGRIDVGVALLDGVGLLLFVIPGIVAYAIDFSTGAIYLPGTAPRVDSGAGPRVVRLNPEALDWATISQTIREHTGQDIPLSDPNLLVYQPRQEGIDVQQELAALAQGASSRDCNVYRASETDFVFDGKGRLVALHNHSLDSGDLTR
jgi:hypothetical protein